MANPKEVARVIGVLTLAYPRAEVKPGMLDVWTPLLSDIPNDLLEAAARQLIVESTFFPSLAELRNKAIELKSASLNIPTWGEAWDECHDKCIRGSRGEFSHPLVEKAYDCIGKQTWDTMLTTEVMATRAHFKQIYEQLVQREEKEIKLLPESRAVSEKYALAVGEVVKKLSANN